MSVLMPKPVAPNGTDGKVSFSAQAELAIYSNRSKDKLKILLEKLQYHGVFVVITHDQYPRRRDWAQLLPDHHGAS